MWSDWLEQLSLVQSALGSTSTTDVGANGISDAVAHYDVWDLSRYFSLWSAQKWTKNEQVQMTKEEYSTNGKLANLRFKPRTCPIYFFIFVHFCLLLLLHTTSQAIHFSSVCTRFYTNTAANREFLSSRYVTQHEKVDSDALAEKPRPQDWSWSCLAYTQTVFICQSLLLWHLVVTHYTFTMQHHYHENNCQTESWCRQCRL